LRRAETVRRLRLVEIGLDDASLTMQRLLAIHDDVRAIRTLLEDEDDGEEDDTDDSGS